MNLLRALALRDRAALDLRTHLADFCTGEGCQDCIPLERELDLAQTDLMSLCESQPRRNRAGVGEGEKRP